MEAVPRMPMLAFELKNCNESETVEFTPHLKAYIAKFYHENPDNYSRECGEIDQLRHSAIRVSRDFVGCSTLKKYYSQLQFLQSRFPIGDSEAIFIMFTWEDVLTGRVISSPDIKFEQGCILYNIGALHSILGALDNRQSPEGMKVSCTHFQCAAWAFQHLRDYFGASSSPDTDHDILTFQINLMLAQAQECILEKSMADNRKSSITAKVAAQIKEYYQLALKSLEASNSNNAMGSRKYKEWKKRIELKLVYQECIMYLYLGNQSEEQQNWGERLAYYQASLTKLNEAVKLAKSDQDEDIDEALKFTMDVVGGKHANAKKENDFIYHESIPDIESLPEVKGASLVKGIPFNPQDPEISGPDIFQKLVPMEAHTASSVYSEEKAKLLREVGGRIEECDNELSQFLSALQLNPDKIKPEMERLPDLLLEKCAALSVKPDAIKDLVSAMQSLSSVATDVESTIKDITDLLDEEAQRESEFQKTFGKRTENVTVDELRRDCAKYEEALSKAAQSNAELHRAMNTHITNLRLLSSPLAELHKALPVYESQSPEDEAIMDRMKLLMDKVKEMKEQRHAFETQFREGVHKDDITSALVTCDQSNQQEFFQAQLKKHDSVIGLLNQNLSAQANILKALTEANAKYATVRKAVAEVAMRRQAMIEGLMQSCNVYDDLLVKSSKGVEFYRKLETNVTRLLERTQRVCKAQEEERRQVMSRLHPTGPSPAQPGARKLGQDMPTAMGYPALPSDPTPLSGDVPAAAPGLTLKDYLPFMKPGTWSKDKTSKGSSAAARATSSVDPALLAAYPGLALLDNPDAAALPGHYGSLPSSQSQSPVHMPKQPSSQPASPAMRHQAYPPPPTLSDSIQSPTAAPGAPSAKRWPTDPASYNGAPPGGPEYPISSQYSVVSTAAASTSLQFAASQAPHAAGYTRGPMPGYNLPSSAYPPSSVSAGSPHPPVPSGAPHQAQNYTQPPASSTSLPSSVAGNPAYGHQSTSAHASSNQWQGYGYVSAASQPAVTTSASMPQFSQSSASPNQYPQVTPQSGGQQSIRQPAGYIPSQQGQNPTGTGVPGRPSAQGTGAVTGKQYPSGPPASYASQPNQYQSNPGQYQTMPGQYQPQMGYANTAFSMPSSSNVYQVPGQQYQAYAPVSSAVATSSSAPYSTPMSVGTSQSMSPYTPQSTSYIPQSTSAFTSQSSTAYTPVSTVYQSPTQNPAQVSGTSTVASNYQQQHTQHQQPGSSVSSGYLAQGQGQYTTQQGQTKGQFYQPGQTQSQYSSQQTPGPFQYPQQSPSQVTGQYQPNQYPQGQGVSPYSQQGTHQAQPQYPQFRAQYPSQPSQSQATVTPAQGQNLAQPSQAQYSSQGAPSQYHQTNTYPGTQGHQPQPNQNLPNTCQTGQYQMPQKPSPYPAVSTQQVSGQTTQYPSQQYPQQQQQQAYPQNSYNAYPAYSQAMPTLPSPLKPTPPPSVGYPSPVPSPAVGPDNKPLDATVRSSSLPPASPLPQESTKLDRQKSVDDILSAGPDKAAEEDVLTPKVITSEDIKRQKEEELKNSLKEGPKDPYVEPAVLDKFIADVEKFGSQVEGLTKQTLSGPTPLEKEWKDLTEEQEKFARQSSIAIARCYPMKNRCTDIMPYDNSRVVLKSGHDDYVNASHIGDLCPSCPKFIATQCPLPCTMADFWQMVFEQGTEVIVMLCQEEEGSQKNHRYWPNKRSDPLTFGHFSINLQSLKSKGSWEERIMTLTHKDTHQCHSIVHLQFTQWPPSGMPDSPAPVLQFMAEVHSFYVQQRSPLKPVVVHCNNGIGRTGAFCAIYTGIQEVKQGHSLVSVFELICQLRRKRRGMVQNRELLHFCYHAILYFAQDILMKRGILTNRASFGDILPAPGDKPGHQRKPSEDFIMGSGSNLMAIQSSVAKMSLKHPHPQTTDHPDHPPGPPPESKVNGAEQEPSVAPLLTLDDPMPEPPPVKSPPKPLPPDPLPQPPPQQKPMNLPPSLAELQDPKTFKLDVTPPSKRKITKDHFLNPQGHVSECLNDPSDPLNQLDPLWKAK